MSFVFLTSMLDKIRKTIKKYRMIDKDETVVVCVSGGIDSVALLHILTGLREEYKLSIIAAHINHRLRGRESDRDEEFVRQLAHNFNVKFVGKRVDTAKFLKRGDSLQDVARQLRYRFFDEVAQRYNADRIATGHTMDDLAETMIMRFLRGTGLSGLSGIPPVRGKYIRPLIDISRQEIEKYVSIHGLNFVRDSSNKKVKYLRNRIRLKLMPVLKDYNPKLMTDLARLAHILRRDEEYLENKAKEVYTSLIVRRDVNIISLSMKKLKRVGGPIQSRIFFIAVEEMLSSSRGFYSCHVEDFLGLLSSKAPNVSIDLPNGLKAYREYDVVTIEKGRASGDRGREKRKSLSFEQRLKVNDTTKVVLDSGIQIAQFKAEVKKNDSLLEVRNISTNNVAYFDSDKLKKPLVVRSFKNGDRFIPFGMAGHKKIKDLFIEKKIPRRSRRMVPILVSGNEILWVVGVRQSEYGKVEAQTKRVLKVERLL